MDKKKRRRRRVQPVRRTGVEIPKLFEGKPGVLLATGPSLSKNQIEYIRPLHERGEIAVLGINDSYRICDFLDVFYFCDPRWLEKNPDAADYDCPEIWTQDPKVPVSHPHIKNCKGSGGKGISLQKDHIHFGGNSGFQLINLAYHMGIREFYLLGYNMDIPRGKQQHFFGPHPKGLNQGNSYRGFVQQFDLIQKEIRDMITNCTYPSALNCFRRKPLEEVFPHGDARYIPTRPKDREDGKPVERSAESSALPRPTHIVRRGKRKVDSSTHCDRTELVAGTAEHRARRAGVRVRNQ